MEGLVRVNAAPVCDNRDVEPPPTYSSLEHMYRTPSRPDSTEMLAPVTELPLPHAPVAHPGAGSAFSLTHMEESASSKWSSPRSIFSVQDGDYAQQMPSVSRVSTGLQMSSGVTRVQTSQQLPTGQMYIMRQKPHSYMSLSIFTMLCCCLFIGMAAVAASTEVETEITAGNMVKAEEASKRAGVTNLIGVLVGVLVIGTVVTLYCIGVINFI